jgi:hypothetical protein
MFRTCEKNAEQNHNVNISNKSFGRLGNTRLLTLHIRKYGNE